MSTPNTHIDIGTIESIMSSAKGKSIHFIGVGGIMMSSLALLTHRLGYRVTGSDRCASPLIDRLVSEGVEVSLCHCGDNIREDCAAVIYTVAISADNPEYVTAQSRGIACISRANYLGYIMTGYKNRIGIAGMHGKSSCTSMCAEIFLNRYKRGHADAPTVISGAEYQPMGGAYYIGDMNDLIFEACEYMDSFLDFYPTVAVLLNADLEHVDYFGGIEQIIESFGRYASLTGESGYAVACADDENIMRAVSGYCGHLVTFGLGDGADYRAVNISYTERGQEFDVIRHGVCICRVFLPSFGEYNTLNALAAFAACDICGVDIEDICVGLSSFKGAKRRMEYRGMINGARVYDDYGHHPTEIRATLSGARRICKGRLICAFQPHTYSRTLALSEDFKNALSEADAVILADIYAARETDSHGISSETLAALIGGRAVYAGGLSAVADEIRRCAGESDTVIIMGAGDIYKVSEMLGL